MIKKISVILLILIIILGTKIIIFKTKSNEITNLNGKIKNNFKINETAIYKKVHYTIKDIKYSDGKDYPIPNGLELENEDNVFVVLTFEVKNNSKSEIVESRPDCILTTSKNNTSETANVFWYGSETREHYLKPWGKSTIVYYIEINKKDYIKEYQCYFKVNSNSNKEKKLIFDLTK